MVAIPSPRFLFCNTCILHTYQPGLWSLQIEVRPAAWAQASRMLIDWTMCQFLVMD